MGTLRGDPLPSGEPVVSYARLRLASLWVSQTTRVLADWFLGAAAFTFLAKPESRLSWQITVAVAVAPFIALAPWNGFLSNRFPRHRVLAASAAIALAAIVGSLCFRLPLLALLAMVSLTA